MKGVRSHGKTVRPLAVAVSVAYVLGILAYPAVRPRLGELAGWPELADDFAPWWYAPAPALILAGLGWRSRILMCAGLAAAAGFVATWGGRFLPPRPRPARAGPTLTAMTFNVLHSNQDHAATAAVIAEAKPDVVALQELGPAAMEQLLPALGSEYPYRALQPVASPSGAGVLSRFPLLEVTSFRLSERGHWAQRMVVEAPSGQVTLLNIHTRIPRLVWSRPLGLLRWPTGFDAGLRHAEVGELVRVLDGVAGPLLVLGDFNLTERNADYRAMRARLGDAYCGVGRGLGHTFPRVFAFPRALPAPWPLLRLDYVWHSAEFRPIAAYVGRSGGGDHHPVIVRFAVTGA